MDSINHTNPIDQIDASESQHRKAVLAVSCACLLVVVIKAGALLQYWQQTHHIFLQFGSLPSASSYLPATPLVKQGQLQWQATTASWSEFVAQSESRMLIAGQLLLLGDKALPVPELPVVIAPSCPEPVAPVVTAQACPEPNTSVKVPPVVAVVAPVTPPETPVDQPANTDTTPADIAENAVTDAAIAPMPEATPEAIAAAQAPIALHPGDRLLLVGDSLMQGLAPHLVTSLKRKFKVDSMDLSKHSTGLTYPAFFDWPATVEDAFELEPYQVVIVFLGANDPWDMTIHGRYIRFASEPWKTVYRERVARIMQTATEHRARIIWLGAPPMGREDLLNKVPTLNAIYAEEAGKHPLFARFVTTDPSLTADGSSFTKFLELPDRGSVMVRTDDGVHFTTQGHRLLAQLTLSQFAGQAAATTTQSITPTATTIAVPNEAPASTTITAPTTRAPITTTPPPTTTSTTPTAAPTDSATKSPFSQQ